jgi:hypothetical protein
MRVWAKQKHFILDSRTSIFESKTVCCIYILYLFPRSRVELEKRMVAQLLKKSRVFYGARPFIATFTKTHYVIQF